MINYREKARAYQDDCVKFLRDLVRIPGESATEGDVAKRICEEMEAVGFDRVWTDDYGNVIGQIGNGPIRIVFDGHIDTVGVGHRDNWDFDPYEGKIEDGYIYGRGASDDLQAPTVQVYGAKVFKENSPNTDRFTVFVVGSIQEEDCDGLGLRYALEESIGDVDYVCMGESTNLDIYRGHRGRMEMEVHATGRSCHGSAPERGDNAVYKMMRLVADIEALNENGLAHDDFLGKGTCAVTDISCHTPSLCAVPDACRIHIDRRLTHGETKEIAIQQIKDLPNFDPASMTVKMLTYDRPSYKGKVLTTEKYYPTWVLPEDHVLVQAALRAGERVLERKPRADKWVFSTNGVSSMGQLGIPTIGFAPGNEEDAHTTNDRLKIEELPLGVAFYAALPDALHELLK